MSWIRKTDEPVERRTTDAATLVIATGTTLLFGLYAQTQSSVDIGLLEAINSASDGLEGVANIVHSLGSIWMVVAIAVLFLALRCFGTAWRVATAGGLAWAVAELLNAVLPAHAIAGLHVDVRTGGGPAFPAASVAVMTAVAFAVSPYTVRPLRRIIVVLILINGLAVIYLGTAYPSDALGGFFLGLAAGALVLVLFGSPAGRPTIAEIREVLADLGYDVADLVFSSETIPRASVVDVTLGSGAHYRVTVFGRDARDAQLAARAWRAAAYREPGVPVFGSRVQQVEHIAYTLLLAERAGVRGPRSVRTGVGGANAAVLVTEEPAGRALRDIETDLVTDQLLDALWGEVSKLHAAGLSHGSLDGSRVVVSTDGQVGLNDFSAADATDESFWQRRDDAAVLVGTALIVGNERAVAAAVKARDGQQITDMLPVVQPVVMPAGTRHGHKHLSQELKELRGTLAQAGGVDDLAPLKIKRLTWTNIGMAAGVLLAVALAIVSLDGINWSSVQNEFEHATWGWVVLALSLWPLIPSSWALALMGSVNTDLPFGPTVLTQVACTFLGLITPDGVGGTALQVDYLHKQGIPLASGGSAMVLSTGVGGIIQTALLLGAAAITATSLDTSVSLPSASQILLGIAVIAALAGLVLWIPKVRGKVMPTVRRTAGDIWSVIHDPHKAIKLVGGNLAGNLLYPLILGVSLLVFHQRLDYAQLVVIQLGAGILGSVAPVPGGLGVQEAALTAGLTAFGIASAPALAAVLVFRGITFLMPPVFGFFTLRWLRNKGYA